ncbi:MFS transporter [Candidatus Parcubacteria bacterium]|nr:MAG: MFS transporter [Candidatus Parcubacteria bacterium]
MMKKYFGGFLWKFYTASFLSSIVFSIAVLVPFYTEWGGLTLAQVQITQAWFMFWAFIMEVPTGVIADRFRRKYSVAFGALLIAIASLIYGSFPDFGAFLFCEFLMAIACALVSGANEALLYDTLKEQDREEESKKVFGRISAVGVAGAIIGTVAGSIIAAKFGLNVPMLATAIPFTLAAIIIWTIKEPAIKAKTSEVKNYFEIAKKGISFFYNHRSLKILAIDSLVVIVAAYFLVWLYQPMLQNLGVPIFYFGFIRAAMSLNQMLISSNFEFLEKLFGSAEAYLKMSALIVGILFLLVAVFPNVVTVLLFVVIGGALSVSRSTLISTYMNKHIPSEQRATILSSIGMLSRVTLAITGPLIGFMADHSLRGTIFFVGLLPLAIFLFSPLKQEVLEEKIVTA